MSKKTADVPTKLPKVIRTSEGLRDALFDEIDRLRNNETTPTAANSLSKLADMICATVELEVKVAKAQRSAKAGAAATPLTLGKS